jgi:hypothetical protein
MGVGGAGHSAKLGEKGKARSFERPEYPGWDAFLLSHGLHEQPRLRAAAGASSSISEIPVATLMGIIRHWLKFLLETNSASVSNGV